MGITLLLRLLFSGGIVTKVVMVVSILGFLGSGIGFLYKDINAKHLKNEVAEQKVKLEQLTTDNTILKQNNATLKDNLDKAATANASTVDANRKLLAERNDAKRALDTLSKQKAVSAQKAADEQKKIDQLLKDPKNDGVLAPVLRETLRDIQNRKKQQ